MQREPLLTELNLSLTFLFKTFNSSLFSPRVFFHSVLSTLKFFKRISWLGHDVLSEATMTSVTTDLISAEMESSCSQKNRSASFVARSRSAIF